MRKEFTPPPPPLAKLASLLLLALLAGTAHAQLVIPATTGTEACTQGVTETRATAFSLGTPTQNSLTFTRPAVTLNDLKTWSGNPGLVSGTLYVGVQEGGRGFPNQRTSFTAPSTSQQSITFSNLKKNTRYTVVVYASSYENPGVRRCFKTRGEFTNAEQNLQPDGSADLTKFGRTGCFAVASTRQDIADCMCNGTRGGTLILAGQTTGSQAARQHWGCPDLDS